MKRCWGAVQIVKMDWPTDAEIKGAASAAYAADGCNCRILTSSSFTAVLWHELTTAGIIALWNLAPIGLTKSLWLMLTFLSHNGQLDKKNTARKKLTTIGYRGVQSTPCNRGPITPGQGLVGNRLSG
jgi:hypothetical protein